MKILIILFMLALAEHLYSVLLKDEVCSSGNTRVNLFTQICGIIKDFTVPGMSVLGIIIAINAIAPHVFNVPDGILSFIACLLLMDFLYYLFHRVSHKFSIPWMFHFVHHSGHNFNLSAGFRSSFLEILVLFTFYSLVLLIGFPLYTFLLVFKITSTYQFMTHSRYLKLPRFMEWVLVTPGYHLRHHDQEIENQNSNFGGVFSCWDRILGTYVKEVENFKPGIKDYRQNNLIKIQVDPMLIIGRKLIADMRKRYLPG